jgi:predicted acyltransferase
MHPTSLTDERVITAKARERLVSVDALRGFDMLWIVGAGSIVQALDKMNADPEHPHRVTQILATQLKHVVWEGFRFYDLIFPLFLFIVGVFYNFCWRSRKPGKSGPEARDYGYDDGAGRPHVVVRRTV